MAARTGGAAEERRAAGAGKLTLVGLLTAAVTTLVTVSVQSAWKPTADLIVDQATLSVLGDKYTGVYNDWDAPPAIKQRERGSENVYLLPHKPSYSAWKMRFGSENFVRAEFSEGPHKFPAVGLLKGDTLVLAFLGDEQGKGTIYLVKNNSAGYYYGFLVDCDCHSPEPHAVMICPYVLYRTADDGAGALAEKDPILKEKCISGTWETLHPLFETLRMKVPAPAAEAPQIVKKVPAPR